MLLSELALDDRRGGNALIYRERGTNWRVYKRVSRAAGKARWFDIAKPSTVVDRKIHVLLEYAYQNPRAVKKVLRFPRELGDSPAAEKPEQRQRIHELVEQVLTSIAQRRKACREIGRACNELKKLVGHGKWQLFFAKTFSPQLNLRTAERYMELARKIDTPSNFTPAMNKRAREMRKATKWGEAEVATVRRRDPASVIDSTINALRRSPHWRAVAPQIIAYLRRLCRKYRVAIATKNTEGSTAA